MLVIIVCCNKMYNTITCQIVLCTIPFNKLESTLTIITHSLCTSTIKYPIRCI
ncbi:Uncharacterised protein [Segatella copri]|nr:Uncharacterised protein [Segatella copri]